MLITMIKKSCVNKLCSQHTWPKAILMGLVQGSEHTTAGVMGGLETTL